MKAEKVYPKRMKILKKADLILIFILAVIPVSMLTYNLVSASKMADPRLVILKDGEVYDILPLTDDRTINIGDTNICEIKDGKVRMIRANCPDLVCVHSAAIDRFGGTIVCLPNRIILTIKDAEEDPNAPDAVTS